MLTGGLIGNSIFLGVGLAMDAFSVSVVHGLTDSDMNRKVAAKIAATFALFQFLMPLIGWICIHTAAMRFAGFERLVPWIALILLVIIGLNMIREGVMERRHPEKAEPVKMTDHILKVLLLQGIATSIDALSVGFAIASYPVNAAILASLLIGAVTFVICRCGVEIGKKIGKKLTFTASVTGGIILIVIGVEIFIRSLL